MSKISKVLSSAQGLLSSVRQRNSTMPAPKPAKAGASAPAGRSGESEQMLQSIHRKADSKSHTQNLKYRLWQPGFYDFNIYSEENLLEKLNYIHGNPVKARLVLSPSDYEWSSYGLYFAEEAESKINAQNL